MTLLYPATGTWAAFVVCSQMIKDNVIYRPVDCQSMNNSFVYVITTVLSYWVSNVEPSCGYLAMTPLSSWHMSPAPNASYSYEDVVKFMRTGFSVNFPFEDFSPWTYSLIINTCLNDSMR
jgi:hypothetical protein